MIASRTARCAAALAVCALLGCSDATGPSGTVTVSLGAQSPTGAALAGDTLVIANGGDTLRITSVEIVLREIELERVDGDECDRDTTGGAELHDEPDHDDDEDPGHDDDDDCEEVSVGPQLVSLPLGPGLVTTDIAIPVDSGAAFDELEFEVHKPGDDALDAAFTAANPDFANISIRVRGTFNGTPFTFTSRLDEEQEVRLDPPLVVGAGGTANVTIRIDVTTWFRGAMGGLIDPATANEGGVNQGRVEENIKRSIRAFEDHDRDCDELNG